MTIVLPLPTRRVRRRRDPPAPGDAASPSHDRIPRVARMLALGHHWKGLIRSGVVEDQAALSALVGVSRARVTQVMDLLHLAPEIQEQILLGSDSPIASEKHLRSIAAQASWEAQRAALGR